MKNAFYFISNASFCSQDIKFLSQLFGYVGKMACLQTIAIHILPNISQSKGNQTMKFDQLIEYDRRDYFFKNYAENEAEILVPDIFLFF